MILIGKIKKKLIILKYNKKLKKNCLNKKIKNIHKKFV